MNQGTRHSTEHFFAVHDTVREYLDGIHEGSVASLARAMHPDCRMVCASDSNYTNMGMVEYFEVVANRQSPKDVGERRLDEIRSIDLVNGDTAVVRLVCLVLGKLCEDVLTLVLDEGAWRIVSKVYTYRRVD
ncbi:MAG: nuclear transport factor 2 family protein [Myxococcota bacterium]